MNSGAVGRESDAAELGRLECWRMRGAGIMALAAPGHRPGAEAGCARGSLQQAHTRNQAYIKLATTSGSRVGQRHRPATPA